MLFCFSGCRVLGPQEGNRIAIAVLVDINIPMNLQRLSEVVFDLVRFSSIFPKHPLKMRKTSSAWPYSGLCLLHIQGLFAGQGSFFSVNDSKDAEGKLNINVCQWQGEGC